MTGHSPLAINLLKLDLRRLKAVRPDDLSPIAPVADDPVIYARQFLQHLFAEAVAMIQGDYFSDEERLNYTMFTRSIKNVRYHPDQQITVVEVLSAALEGAVTEESCSRCIAAVVTLSDQIDRLAILDIPFNQNDATIAIYGNVVDKLRQSTTWSLRPMSTFQNLDRSYMTCLNLSETRLISMLCQSHVREFEPDESSSLKDLNAEQSRIVHGFSKATDGLYLVQGPPGTGKTTTIVRTLEALVKLGERVLVCAPSNKAVHLLVGRMRREYPHMPIMLVGSSHKHDDRLNDVSMRQWVKRYVDPMMSLIKSLGAITLPRNLILPGYEFPVNRSVFNPYYEGVRNKIHLILDMLHVCMRYIDATVDAPTCIASIEQHCSQYLSVLQEFVAQKLDLPMEARAARVSQVDYLVSNLRTTLERVYTAIQGQMEMISAYLPTSDQNVLRKARIVFCTLSVAGRSSWSKLMKGQEPFSSIVIDEAAQALEVESLHAFTLASNARKALIVGDTRQLPPTTLSATAKPMHFDWSIMWRLIEENHVRYHQLSTQYRMRQLICCFPSQRYYQGALECGPSVHDRESNSSSFIPLDQGINAWIDVKGHEESHNKSYINRVEAEAISLIIAAIRQRDSQSRIGVVAFYRGQVNHLRTLLDVNGLLNDQTTVDTVDGFQGDECEIILLSCVRANFNRKIGFIDDFRRLNVAITRAKDALFVFGDCRQFDEAPENEVKHLLDFYRETNHLIPFWVLLEYVNSGWKCPSVKDMPKIDVLDPSELTKSAEVRRGRVSAHRHDKVMACIKEAETLIAANKHEDAIAMYHDALAMSIDQGDLYRCIAWCYAQLHNIYMHTLYYSVWTSLDRSDASSTTSGLAQSSSFPAAMSAASGLVQPPLLRSTIPTTPCALTLASMGLFAVVSADRVSRAAKPPPCEVVETREFRQSRITAEEHCRNARQSSAIKIFQDLQRQSPLNWRVLCGLGWCYFRLKNYKLASDYFRQSLNFSFGDVNTYYGLAQCYSVVGELDKSYVILDEIFGNPGFRQHKMLNAIREYARRIKYPRLPTDTVPTGHLHL